MGEITDKNFQELCERALVDGAMTDDELETVIRMCTAATRLGVPMERIAIAIMTVCGYQSRHLGQEIRHLLGPRFDFTTYSWLLEGTRGE